MTTITRGEQSVTSESIMNYSNENKQAYPAIAADKKNLKFRVVEKVFVAHSNGCMFDDAVTAAVPNIHTLDKLAELGILT